MKRWLLLLLIAPLAVSCRNESARAAVTLAAGSNNQTNYQVRGVVKEISPRARTVTVKHEEVPGYMPAMTMPFDVRNANELTGLKTNDTITFRMVVTDTDGWIENIRKVDSATNLTVAPEPAIFRRVRNVDSLNEGDLLPEYHFTNELNRAVNTKQFLGQAVALTFIFTSCPFPDFCPRMSSGFDDAAAKLKTMANAPTNWHLLSVSFDTRVDSPEKLLDYAKRYGSYNPARWNFLTGNLEEIDAITEQFGLFFVREADGSLSHNLRTVVIDTHGRVQKIFTGNKWTGDEVVEELLKAAAAQ